MRSTLFKFLWLVASMTSCQGSQQAKDLRPDDENQNAPNTTNEDDAKDNNDGSGDSFCSQPSNLARKRVYLVNPSLNTEATIPLPEKPKMHHKPLQAYIDNFKEQTNLEPAKDEWLRYEITADGKIKLRFENLDPYMTSIRVTWLPQDISVTHIKTEGKSSLTIPYEFDFEGAALLMINYHGATPSLFNPRYSFWEIK